jgi:hypothetical protein
MIRPILIEFILFITPFVLYAAFLAATRAGLLDVENWPLSRVVSLVIASLVLVVGSFVYFAHFSGSPPGSTYVPAHMDNGRFVPGTIR